MAGPWEKYAAQPGGPWEKYGGAPSAPPEQAAYAPEAQQSVGHGLSEGLSSINPFPGIGNAIMHPLDTAKGLYNAQADRLKAVPDLVKQGRYSEAAGNGLAGILPLVGPAAASIGEQIGGSDPQFDKYGNVVKQGQKPDVVGGAARGIGTVGSIMAAPGVTRLAGRAAEATGRGLAKTALGLPSKAEAFGATPAQAVLQDTRGVRPETIARTGRDSMARIKPQMEGLVSKATQPVDLIPPREIVSTGQDVAARQGNKLVHDQIQPMGEALAGNRVTGAPYPSSISPADALDLKRGFGDEFASFNPDIHQSVNALAKDVYGNLSRQIHEAAPGTQELDQRVQSLIPVVHRAETVSRNAGVGQRVLNRMSRPTGGMLPALLGYHEGGIPGAAMGLVGSEATASPVPLMIGARTAYRGGRIAGSPLAQRAAQIGPLLRTQKPQ